MPGRPCASGAADEQSTERDICGSAGTVEDLDRRRPGCLVDDRVAGEVEVATGTEELIWQRTCIERQVRAAIGEH